MVSSKFKEMVLGSSELRAVQAMTLKDAVCMFFCLFQQHGPDWTDGKPTSDNFCAVESALSYW